MNVFMPQIAQKELGVKGLQEATSTFSSFIGGRRGWGFCELASRELVPKIETSGGHPGYLKGFDFCRLVRVSIMIEMGGGIFFGTR